MTPLLLIGGRECPKCRLRIPEEHWGAHRVWCKHCINAYNRAYRARHAERVRQQGAAYYRKDIERSRARAREQYRRRERRNPGQALANNRSWRARNHERWLEIARANNARRYVRKLGAAGTATADQIAARIQYWGGRCWICKGEGKEIDHVKPLARGGAHWPCNLRPVCRSCNARKKDRWPWDFAR